MTLEKAMDRLMRSIARSRRNRLCRQRWSYTTL